MKTALKIVFRKTRLFILEEVSAVDYRIFQNLMFERDFAITRNKVK